MRTDLLSIIAHELRTPITVMRTLTGSAPRSGVGPDRRAAPDDARDDGTERRADAGPDRRDPRPRPLPVRHDRAPTAPVRRPRAGRIGRRHDPATGRTARPDRERLLADGRGPRVYGDRPRLDRALLNLVANAQRFAPDEGHVTLRLEEADRTASSAGRSPTTGPASPTRTRSCCSSGSSSAGTIPAKAREGLGLGLPTALAIAQAHGGTIEVAAASAKGSTFGLVVPAAGPKEEV